MSGASSASIVARVKGLNASATAAQCVEIAATVRADLTAAEAAHKRLTSQRRAVLLEGDDDKAAQHDAAIAAEARRQDRARILIEEVEKLRARAAAREEGARLDARRQTAAKTAAELTAALVSEYELHAKAIAAFLARWQAGHQLIDDANVELRQAGRADLVQSPEGALRARPAKQEPDTVTERDAWFLGGRPIGACVMVEDRHTGKLRPQAAGAELRKVRETVKGEFIPHQTFPPLHKAVRLPATQWDKADLWKPAS